MLEFRDILSDDRSCEVPQGQRPKGTRREKGCLTIGLARHIGREASTEGNGEATDSLARQLDPIGLQ